VPDAGYYRQQAERFDRVADQCSIADLVPYYRKLAFDYLTRAVRAESTPKPLFRRSGDGQRASPR
jgi:hypothetical protein